MSAALAEVGRLADGRVVHAARLGAPGGLQAQVWSFGATLRSLTIPHGGREVEVLAGPADFAAVEADTMSFGRALGRVANRIGGARFELDGVEYHLAANRGAHMLHGGARGWGHALWRFEAAEPTRAVLAYTSPDGDMGFPGAVEARVTFACIGDDTLEIAWEATCDRPTPVNMTHHPYFNLSGDPHTDVLDHRLTVRGAAVTEVGEGQIPTAALLPVEGTPFDLREGRRVGDVVAAAHPQIALAGGLDQNWALDKGDANTPAVVLGCPDSGLRLEVSTDQPGCQIYDGHGIGPPLRPHAGLAIEPQGFPDSPNQPTFPSVTLRPGEFYRRRARYRLVSA